MTTSKLQEYTAKQLYNNLGHLTIRENYRADWLLDSQLSRLELDFYIPDLCLAIEVQGDQHFAFIPFFHKNQEGFALRKQRDREKADLCYGRDIRLVEVCTQSDIDILIHEYIAKLRSQPKYRYAEPAGIPRIRQSRTGRRKAGELKVSEKHARRLVLSKPNSHKTIRKIARLMTVASKWGMEIADEVVANYYRENREQIDRLR